ncbi:MAG: adenylyl-sulfate kinase [Gemmatimonadetes bacterium]|nr:adenylyl-sulfate kinase [Gemmatimonadota bacterium]
METRGFTVWFTGLSGSGKSTIARLVADEIRRRRSRVELLSGSEFRRNLSQGLGFSPEDRMANVRRIGYVARLLTRNGVAVVTTTVSPDRAVRDECRAAIGQFIEVWVDCPPEVCERRDRKGLWARARRGELSHFAGIADAYEPPLAAEVVCRTAHETAEQCAAKVITHLEEAGWIPPTSAVGDEPIVRQRLRDLGYA